MSTFSAAVIERFNAPRHAAGPLEGARYGVDGPPGEGPYAEVWLLVENNRIAGASFRTYGCPAALACADLACELAESRTVEQAMRIESADLIAILGGLPEGKAECAERAVVAMRAALRGDP